MKYLQTQRENIKKLLKLIEENPSLEILPMVSTECVPGDDYSYWMAGWGNADIDEYYVTDERIYFKSIDFDELVEKHLIVYEKEHGPECIMYESENEKLVEEEVNKLNWIKAIVIYINEPELQ